MELPQRYVHAVGSYLPRAQRADIVAELAEDIRSEIDDRAARLGRPLNEAEQENLLLERGHPMVVAGGYLPQRALIGPALLPIYFLVLKIVVAVVIAAFFLVVAPIRISEGTRLFDAIVASAVDVWFVIWIPIGVVTVIFASIERVQLRDQAAGWSPRRLPRAVAANAISRAQSIAGGVLTALFALWWVSNAPVPAVGAAGFAVWRAFYHDAYFSVLALALANVALAVANTARPYWTPLRLSWRAAVDGLTAAVAVFVVVAAWPVLAEEAALVARGGAAAGAEVAAILDLSLAAIAAIVALQNATTCCLAGVRAVRMRSAHRR